MGKYDYDPENQTVTFHSVVEGESVNMNGPLKNLSEPLKLRAESDSMATPDSPLILGEYVHVERTSNAHVLMCAGFIEKVTSIKYQAKESAAAKK